MYDTIILGAPSGDTRRAQAGAAVITIADDRTGATAGDNRLETSSFDSFTTEIASNRDVGFRQVRSAHRDALSGRTKSHETKEIREPDAHTN